MTRKLITHHPNTKNKHWLFVEYKGEIVSTLCLIPWKLKYGTCSIDAGEMGIVGTKEEFRKRGLIRSMVNRFDQMLVEEKMLLSHIQGIPYFYRQFGYDYAVQLENHFRLELHQIPDLEVTHKQKYSLRQAAVGDIPRLQHLYEGENARYTVSALRTAGIWEYLLGPSKQTDMDAETICVEDTSAGSTAGYFRIAKHGFGRGLNVCETSDFPAEALLEVTQHLKRICTAYKKPFIRLNLPRTNSMVRHARSIGAAFENGYAWQVRLPDAAGFLNRIAPELQNRSDAARLQRTGAAISGNLTFDLYREKVVLEIKGGRIAGVTGTDHSGRGMKIPPHLTAPYFLGYKSRGELGSMHHDFHVDEQWKPTLDTLFPRTEGFIYTQY